MSDQVAGGGQGGGGAAGAESPRVGGAAQSPRVGGGAESSKVGGGAQGGRSGAGAPQGGLGRLWAGWRSTYIAETATQAPKAECVLCAILASDEVLWRDTTGLVAAVLNAYPYTAGHLMVLPTRHVADPEALDEAESRALWHGLVSAVTALKAAYRPDGLNLGANLGRSAGAGVPGHFHLHALPRWDGDTNFMTTVAETRVLPETLSETAAKLRAAWPA